MSRQAIEHVALLGKAPTSRHDIHRILQLADCLANRRDGESEPMPDNVIAFPGLRRGKRGSAKGGAL